MQGDPMHIFNQFFGGGNPFGGGSGGGQRQGGGESPQLQANGQAGGAVMLYPVQADRINTQALP